MEIERETERESSDVLTSAAEVGPVNECAGEGQQILQITDPSSRQRGYYIRAIKQVFS
jgi:hypothetical protein